MSRSFNLGSVKAVTVRPAIIINTDTLILERHFDTGQEVKAVITVIDNNLPYTFEVTAWSGVDYPASYTFNQLKARLIVVLGL
jgi:hypothetical protein